MRKGKVVHKAAAVGSRGGYPTIGLLCREISSEYGMAMWNGVSSAAQKRKANLICVLGGSLGLAKHSEDGMANQLYDLLDADTFDGLVMWGAALGHFGGSQVVQELCERCRPLPVVNIGLELEGIPNVLVDNCQGARDAVAHLIEVHGHRRIAYLSGPEANWEARERYRGYTSALAEHGIPFDPALVIHMSDLDEQGRRRAAQVRVAMRILMDRRGLQPRVDFDAVMAYDDDMGIDAMNTLQSCGVQVPGEVAIASFDDIESARCVTPPLTTVRQPLFDLGQRATEILLDWVESRTTPKSMILPMQVVVRQSCGCASEFVAQATVETTTRAGENVKLDTALGGKREDILTELTRVAGTTLGNSDPAWAARLLDGFIRGVQVSSPGVFLRELENSLNRVVLMGGDPQTWQEVVSTFRRCMLPYLGCDTLSRAEHLWLQAGILVSEVAQRVQAHRVLQRARWTQTLFEIETALITAFDVPTLVNMLVEGLPRLGIPGCYVAVYEDPQLPNRWSRLLLAYDAGGRVNLEEGGRRFASRQWVSDGILPLGKDDEPSRPRSYITEPLYFHEHQIGFALVEVGPCEGIVYELLRGEISSALYGAQLVQQLARRAVQLQTAAEVSRAASSLLDPNALIQHVVDLVRERFDLCYVGLFLVDRFGDWTGEPGRWVVLRAGTGDAGRELLRGGHKLEIGGSSMIGECVAYKQTRVTLDINAEAVRLNNLLLPETRSELVLPLVSRGEAIGALSIQGNRIAAFSEQDIAVFQTMADQLANAICNADLYEQAQKAQESAEEANRAKSAFLANMSHELRTPLNAILGFSQLMKNDPNATAEQLENFNIITRSGEHLLNLINNVLDISKIEAGRVTLEETTLDLYQLMQELRSLMHVHAEEKGLNFTVEQSSEVPRYIRVDAVKLRQVLINLIGNAIKYTNEGHIALRVRKSQTTNDQSQHLNDGVCHLEFEVVDTGSGIDADDRARIFTPFVQLANQPAGQAGTGLGLTISKQYVELMGGHINVTSEPGRGSVFHVELPVVVVLMAEQPVELQRGHVMGLAAGQPCYRLLIVEDQADNRLLLCRLLEPLGFEIREAVNGQEAVDQCAEWQPDLIWMDMRMPGMDGLEATRRIKATEAGARIKIIALTAHALEGERREILAAGCDDFIRKPYREQEVFDVLAKHLGVRLVYAEEAVAEAVAAQPDVVALATLPNAVLNELEQALRQLEPNAIDRAIDDVRSYDVILAGALSAMARNFQYGEVLSLIENVRGEAGREK